MTVQSVTHGNLEGLCIENEWLRLTVLPKLGAKIASIVFKPHNFEVLFQPETGYYKLPTFAAPFDHYDTSGADEMYPTIDECSYPSDDYPKVICPDHGELWAIPWKVTNNAESIVSKAEGKRLPYLFERNLTLDGTTISFNYSVTNKGTKPLLGLWAYHGLVACDEHTIIELPETADGRREVANVQDSPTAGPQGTILSFPEHHIAATNTSIDRVAPAETKTTRKHYVDGRVAKGIAAMTLNMNRLRYEVRFPHEEIPYLGVWINEGGFKDEFNCALEPSNGYYDRLDWACRNETIRPILPGDTRTWWMKINLTENEGA